MHKLNESLMLHSGFSCRFIYVGAGGEDSHCPQKEKYLRGRWSEIHNIRQSEVRVGLKWRYIASVSGSFTVKLCLVTTWNSSVTFLGKKEIILLGPCLYFLPTWFLQHIGCWPIDGSNSAWFPFMKHWNFPHLAFLTIWFSNHSTSNYVIIFLSPWYRGLPTLCPWPNIRVHQWRPEQSAPLTLAVSSDI